MLIHPSLICSSWDYAYMEIYLGHHINQTDTWPLSKPIYLSSRLGTKPLKILLIHSHILSQGVCRWMCQSFYQSLICSFSLYATPSRPISSAAFFLPVTVTVPTATVNLYEVDLASQKQATALGLVETPHTHSVRTSFQGRGLFGLRVRAGFP